MSTKPPCTDCMPAVEAAVAKATSGISVLPPLRAGVDRKTQEDADFIRNPDNQLAILARIARNTKGKARDKIAALTLVHKINIEERKAIYDDFAVRYRHEVGKLVESGYQVDAAIEALEETLECLPPNRRQQIILMVRMSLS